MAFIINYVKQKKHFFFFDKICKSSFTQNMINVILLAVLSVLLACLFLNNKKKNSWASLFPTPSPTHFFFGHFLRIKNTTGLIFVISNYLTKFGSTIKLDLGPVDVGIVTSDPKLIEVLLTSNKILKKSQNYLYLTPWLGKGLILSDGAIWRKHRKILTPAFHFEILKDFVQVFESVGQVFVEKLANIEDRNAIDLFPLVKLCTLDAIFETSMGTRINAQLNEESSYVLAVKEICRIVIDRCLNPFKLYNATYRLTRDFWKQKKTLRIIHNYSESVIRSKTEQNITENNVSDGKSSRKKLAFLDLILKYSKAEENTLSLEEIREEVDTFMFAGHDTTASSICFGLHCLATNPEIQGRVLEEQKELFGDEKNPEITYNDLQNMKYLDMVIKEVIRMYPPVPIIGRYLTEDVTFDGKIIPKNVNIGIHIYALHRNPNYFPEPEKFDPERFSSSKENFPSFCYIPFSAGPRNCIGQKFAMLEVKSIISKIIRNFELSPAIPQHNLVLAGETVLVSKNGVKVAIKQRD